ncbi:MAG: hypothetical protein ACR2GH_21800 [Pseudonocardia sp.]
MPNTPSEQLEQIRELIRLGTASSVSGFMQHSVGVVLADLVEWRTSLDEALADTGGPVTEQERAWAEETLGVEPARTA